MLCVRVRVRVRGMVRVTVRAGPCVAVEVLRLEAAEDRPLYVQGRLRAQGFRLVLIRIRVWFRFTDIRARAQLAGL